MVNDPYGIAQYDSNGVFSNLSLNARQNLPLLAARTLGLNSLVDSRTQIELNSSTEDVIVLVHGWVRKSTDVQDPFSGEAWQLLIRNLSDRIPDQAAIVEYNWGQDAFVPFSPWWYSSLPEAQTAGEKAGALASERAYQHGLVLGKMLIDQIGAENLHRVHFIAHSAGNWTTYAAMSYLRNRVEGITAQLTLLDPAIPGQMYNAFPDGHVLDGGLLEGIPYNIHSDGVHFKADAYYTSWDETELWFSQATTVTWKTWGGEDSGAFDTVAITHDGFSFPYKLHSGPIRFYAETISRSNTPERFKSQGWERSIFYAQQVRPWQTDPYSIAQYEPSGWSLYDDIPMDNRKGLVGLSELAMTELRDNTGVPLGTDNGKLIIIFHGWNDSAERMKPLTDALSDHQRLPSGWKVIRYDWSGDAATGNTFPYFPSAQKAAERAYQHGLLVGGKILQQVGAANLEKVHFIGHSAGAWAVLAAARCVNLNTDITEVQVTFLDPYIPNNDSTLIPHGHPFHRSYMESAPVNCARINSIGPLKGEAYWSDDPITWPKAAYPNDAAPFGTGNYTQVTWNWGPESRSLVAQTDNDAHGAAHWDGHDGPIRFYLDSIVDPSDSNLGVGGWKNSLAYRDTQLVTTNALIGRVTSRVFPHHGIGGAIISLDSGGTSTTAQDGTYTLTGLTPGTYTVTASHPDFYGIDSAASDAKSVTLDSTSINTVNFGQFLGRAVPEVLISISDATPLPGETIEIELTVKNVGSSVENVDTYLDLSSGSESLSFGDATGTGWTDDIGHYALGSTIHHAQSGPLSAIEPLVSARRTGSFIAGDSYSLRVPLTISAYASAATDIVLKYRATIADRRDPVSISSGIRDQQGYSIYTAQIIVKEPPPGTATVQLGNQPLAGGHTEGGGTHSIGSLVSIRAIPADGYVFERWSDGNTSDQREIEVPVGGLELVAEYSLVPYTVDFSAEPTTGGTVQVTPATAHYNYGDNVSFFAIPETGYVFSHWSFGDIATTEEQKTQNPISMNVAGDLTAIAHFTEEFSGPQITTQPASLTRFVGEDATFSVSASGSTSLSYQWYFDGSALAGENGEALHIESVEVSHAGDL